MGLGSIVKFLLPRDDKFLNYFEQAADNLKKAGELYVSLAKVNSRAELIALRDEIKRLEHVGDELTHKIFEELNLSFITPFDREDIYELTKGIDDVLDLIDHVADLLLLYQIDKMENEGDRLYRLFMGKLFAEQKDAIVLLKYNSLYNEMEHAIDKCEDLMNCLESIMLKNA